MQDLQKGKDTIAALFPMVRKAVKRYIRNQDDAEDVLQTAMLHLLKSTAEIQHNSAWVYSVVKNASIDLFRMHIRIVFGRVVASNLDVTRRDSCDYAPDCICVRIQNGRLA